MIPARNKHVRSRIVRPLICVTALLCLLAFGFLSSCTIWKRTDRQTTLDSHLQSRSILDSSRWIRMQSGQDLQYSHSGQRLLILPRGPIRYHPDSGFIGGAGYLLLEGYRHTAIARQDTLHREGIRLQRRDSLDTMLHRAEQYQQEKDLRPALQLPWWGWGILILGILMLVAWRLR